MDLKKSIFVNSLGLLLFLFATNNYAWNSQGHQLIAQIAYDNLTPQARKICDEYNHYLDTYSPSPNFVHAATWLDAIRRNDVHWFDGLHYIDLPFSKDHTRLPSVQKVNALWGIKQALLVLSSKKSTSMDKALSLRILTHLIGDIHQPLHTTTMVSQKWPKGDLGGNLFPLGKNPIATNLHQYWDKGAGILVKKNESIKDKALSLEKIGSCPLANSKKWPQQWIKEAHQLAITQVYTISPYQIPSKKYQLNAQNISKKQIVFAGCRLAALLNDILFSI